MLTRTTTYTLLYLVLALLLGTVFGLFFTHVEYAWQGLVLVVLGIAVVALFLFPRMAWRERSPFLMQLLFAGLLLKLGASIARLWVSFGLYGGVADAAEYHTYGIYIAKLLRQMKFDQALSYLEWGTNFMKLFTGVLYTVIGPTLYGGYLVYGFLSFLGSYYFYRAFRTAFPEGNKVLFALLIFLYPTLLFWPNGISKDALIFLAIGLSAYGSAHVLRGHLSGAALLALGLLGALWVRPHMAGFLAVSLALGFLIPTVGKGATGRRSYLAGLAVAVGLLWFLLPRAMSYMGLEQLSMEAVVEYATYRQLQTFDGGAAFQTPDVLNPLFLPVAVVTVLFRPFPWEAHNIQALVESLSGVLLLGVGVWRFQSVTRAIGSFLADPVVRYVMVYIAIFLVAFATMSNFGLLARERAMLLPFIFMLLAYSPRQQMAIEPAGGTAT